MIEFQTVRWKNFLSTGNQFTEVQLNRSPTTLIIGENGAGKSSILDALCFGLFGKPFRPVNKSQLINSINEKGAVVEVEFKTQNKQCKIVRGIKPNTFEIYIEGKMANQDASARDYQKYLEEQILKLNYKSFTQVVILGSSTFVPFMQLSAKARREVVEDILDIRIFSLMNHILKIEQRNLQDDITENDNEIQITEDRVDLIKQYIDDVTTNRETIIKENVAESENNQKEIDKLKAQTEDIRGKKEKLLDKLTNYDQDQIKIKHQKLVELNHTIAAKVSHETSRVEFFHDNDNCPECNQQLTEDFKKEQIQNKEAKIQELKDGLGQLDNHIKEIENQQIALSNTASEIKELDTQLSIIQSRIEGYSQAIIKYQDKIKSLSEDSVSNDQVKKLEQCQNKIDMLIERKMKLKEDYAYYDIMRNLLQDTGIKTKIIKKYLPVMNNLINTYLTSMDFFCNFNIDENFNETIKSRYRDDFTYQSFSEGEKMRIDLALLFTWRQIAKMKNSTNTNLLILDEIFDSSLDSTGTDDFLKILNTLTDQNVFVISHKGDILYDKFRSIIKFEKQKNFSRISA